MYGNTWYMIVMCADMYAIIMLSIDIAWRIKQIRKENKHAKRKEDFIDKEV